MQFLFTITVTRIALSQGQIGSLIAVRNPQEDDPTLADQRFLLFPLPETQTYFSTNLYSTAIQKIVELVHPDYDIHELFDITHQRYEEEGIQYFIDAVTAQGYT